MYDLYYWATPNGQKIAIFLEEAALPYRLHFVNIGAGEQFKPEFLKISPNNKMPALIDTEPKNGKRPVELFESGAILLYLGEKTGKFLPTNLYGRVEVLKWLFWQVGGVGPMFGQNFHFQHAAKEKIPYALERYNSETRRLFGVLDKQLAEGEFVAGEYSIADMAILPWVVPHAKLGIEINEFPNTKRWLDTLTARPAIAKALKIAPETAT